MHLCYGNPQLLSHKWATKLIDEYSGSEDIKGATALMKLF